MLFLGWSWFGLCDICGILTTQDHSRVYHRYASRRGRLPNTLYHYNTFPSCPRHAPHIYIYIYCILCFLGAKIHSGSRSRDGHTNGDIRRIQLVNQDLWSCASLCQRRHAFRTWAFARSLWLSRLGSCGAWWTNPVSHGWPEPASSVARLWRDFVDGISRTPEISRIFPGPTGAHYCHRLDLWTFPNAYGLAFCTIIFAVSEWFVFVRLVG